MHVLQPGFTTPYSPVSMLPTVRFAWLIFLMTYLQTDVLQTHFRNQFVFTVSSSARYWTRFSFSSFPVTRWKSVLWSRKQKKKSQPKFSKFLQKMQFFFPRVLFRFPLLLLDCEGHLEVFLKFQNVKKTQDKISHLRSLIVSPWRTYYPPKKEKQPPYFR